MHTGVILLTKAENREEALDNATTFLEDYGDGEVWDWYSVGNRWNNTLAPQDKLKEFNKKVLLLYPKLNGPYETKYVENDIDRPIIQKLWNDSGLTGRNPYWDSYAFSIEDSSDDYNVVPLESCIETVKDWVKDLKKAAIESFDKIVENHQKYLESKNIFQYTNTMSGYYAEIYKNVVYESFCFDTNVFNITTGEAEQIPDDISGYYAVMIDMHN